MQEMVGRRISPVVNWGDQIEQTAHEIGQVLSLGFGKALSSFLQLMV